VGTGFRVKMIFESLLSYMIFYGMYEEKENESLSR
jgi:hypothetical protein